MGVVFQFRALFSGSIRVFSLSLRSHWLNREFSSNLAGVETVYNKGDAFVPRGKRIGAGVTHFELFLVLGVFAAKFFGALF